MKRALWVMMMMININALGQYSIHGRFIGAAMVQGQNPSIWDLMANPASFSDSSGTMAGFNGEQKFMSPLSAYVLGCSGRLFQEYMSVCLDREGTRDFSRQSVSMGVGKKIAEGWRIGARLGYRFSQVNGYGSRGGLTAGLGLSVTCGNRIRFAIQCDQFNGFFSEKALWPYRIYAAAGYSFSSIVGISMDVVQEEGRTPDFSCGMSYRFHPLFIARLAFSTGSDIFFFSLGFQVHDIHIDVGTSLHQALGPTASLHLWYRFKKENS